MKETVGGGRKKDAVYAVRALRVTKLRQSPTLLLTTFTPCAVHSSTDHSRRYQPNNLTLYPLSNMSRMLAKKVSPFVFVFYALN